MIKKGGEEKQEEKETQTETAIYHLLDGKTAYYCTMTANKRRC